MQDLAGILVISLEQAVAAPHATARLVDAGARVIKVERPEGDFARGYDRFVHGESSYFVWTNRGKESICLDLKAPGDLEQMLRMIARADVFVQNLAPGAAARLGLGAADLLALNPRLIHVSVSGYGEDGPYRDQKAYDMLIQGESGLLSVNGTPEGSARVGISVCDIAAGENAFSAILQALIGRQQSGKGRAIEVSLFHTMADWLNVPYLQARYSGKGPERMGLRHPSIAPYGAYDCADGGAVLLSVQSDREWRNMCQKLLDRPELAEAPEFATNVARVANREAADAVIAPVLAALDRETAIARLTAAGIACGRLSSLDDLIAHPQARHLSTETATGSVEMMGRGVRHHGQELPGGAVPGLGQHSRAVAAEFGPDPVEASGLARRG
ncbi:Formyl-coenzyme A transferase [Paracoccus haematequi]|uniref:Formyl-coenzyme A transferase n=1 Tax=Paracoccus haematequi TaxID=2491866 RepID=A0A3S4CHK2_9RHOB|nr:CaiB/BaiF CoA-transferase family protein [Paracoccus haematequi]VDS07882.1 Formyl-coenzyme A transferase [Paracoccus haematequi]